VSGFQRRYREPGNHYIKPRSPGLDANMLHFQSEVVLKNPSRSASVSRLLLLLLFVESILERDFTSTMMLGEGTGGRHS
jgi:hypothetical protein